MVKLLSILILLSVSSGMLYANPANDSVFNKAIIQSFLSSKKVNSTTDFKLFIFLSPECPLCQQASASLNKLYKQYNKQVAFYGVVPGKTYNRKMTDEFAKKYAIEFALLDDRNKALTKYLQATITPQVILLNKNDELVYKGAIDNLMETLGKKRLFATEFFLADAVEKSIQSSGFFVKRTKAVGCSINDY